MSFARRSGRAGPIFLAVVVLGSLLVYPVVRSTYAATPSDFATVTNPVGLATRPDAIFVAVGPDCPPKVRKFNRSGVEQPGPSGIPFVTLSSANTCPGEPYVAAAPNLGSFAGVEGNLYVTQGRRVIEIAKDGLSTKVVFALPGSFSSTNNGIVFDVVGTWNFNLIIIGRIPTEFESVAGQVRRFRRSTLLSECPFSDGPVSGPPCLVQVGTAITLQFPDEFEGVIPIPVGGPPAVMPLTFAKCPGGLLAASTFDSGSVWCVQPSGTFSMANEVGIFAGAKAVLFIEPNPCSFGPTDGPSDGSIFTASFDQGKVKKFPPTDVTSPPQASPGLDGRFALIMSGTGVGIAKLGPGTANPPSSLADFDVFHGTTPTLGNLRGVGMCGRHRVQVMRLPGGTPRGKIPFVILSAPGFTPHTMIAKDPTKTTCGKFGNERSVSHFDNGKTDFNGDGIPDLKVHCDMKLTGLGPGDKAQITGFFVPQSPDEGFAGGE